jgi:hypothetical protein
MQFGITRREFGFGIPVVRCGKVLSRARQEKRAKLQAHPAFEHFPTAN